MEAVSILHPFFSNTLLVRVLLMSLLSVWHHTGTGGVGESSCLRERAGPWEMLAAHWKLFHDPMQCSQVTFLAPSWKCHFSLWLMPVCLPASLAALPFSYWWIAVFPFEHLLSHRYRFHFCNTCCNFDLLVLWLVSSFFSDLQFQKLPEVLQANSWCKLLPESDCSLSFSGTQSNKEHFQHILVLKPSV